MTQLEVSLPLDRHARGRGEQGSGVGESGRKACVSGFKVGRVEVVVITDGVLVLCGQETLGWAQVLSGTVRSLIVEAGATRLVSS